MDTPGHFKIVWMSEFSRIYTNVQPWLDFKWTLYYDEMKDSYFREYFYAILVFLFITVAIPRASWKKETLVFLLMPFVFLVIITIPDSKMFWYSAPAFPLLCFLLALMCVSVFNSIRARLQANRTLIDAVFASFFALVFVFQAKEILQFVKKEKREINELEYGIYALREFKPDLSNVDTCRLFNPIDPAFIHHLDVLQFYKSSYNLKSRIKLDIASHLKSGDLAIVSNPRFMDTINKSYTYKVIDSCVYGKLISIQ